MKELSVKQVEKVSGGCFLGSILGKLSKPLGEALHNLESSIYDATLGKIPVLGGLLKDIVTDPLGTFKQQ